jgi:hypothetical protein
LYPSSSTNWLVNLTVFPVSGASTESTFTVYYYTPT